MFFMGHFFANAFLIMKYHGQGHRTLENEQLILVLNVIQAVKKD